jgi:sugar phosphate isomerase/epimerase
MARRIVNHDAADEVSRPSTARGQFGRDQPHPLPTQRVASGGWRLPIAASTLGLPSRLGTEDSGEEREIWLSDLRRLASRGFADVDLVDTWISPAELSPPQLENLRDAIQASGLRLVGISVIRKSIIDPEFGERNLAHTHRSIDAAVILGSAVVSIGFHRPLTPVQQHWAFWSVPGPRDDDNPDTRHLAVTRLKELAVHAEKVGVLLSLELYEDTLLGSGRLAAEIVRDVGSPALGINPDLANLYRVPRRLAETWQETLLACLPYMNYWHVKNFRRVEVYPTGPFLSWPTVLSDGDIDYALALRMVRDAGYAGPICIEHYGGDALWHQLQGLHYLMHVMEAE